jgi:hypothetical protein
MWNQTESSGSSKIAVKQSAGTIPFELALFATIGIGLRRRCLAHREKRVTSGIRLFLGICADVASLAADGPLLPGL